MLGDGGVRAIAAAATGTSVLELELGGCGSSPEALADAKAAVVANRIRHISLDQAGTDATLADLGLTIAHVPSLLDALATNRSLRTLNLNGEFFRLNMPFVNSYDADIIITNSPFLISSHFILMFFSTFHFSHLWQTTTWAKPAFVASLACWRLNPRWKPSTFLTVRTVTLENDFSFEGVPK